MAVDQALAEHRSEGEATLRLYGWVEPTLSLGRNQPEETGAELGVPRVRRITGGREVLHDRELTYAVVVPAAGIGGARALYRAVNEVLVAALRPLGVEGALASGGNAVVPPRAGAGVCFGDPAPGEVMARGRKLVGSAQRRMGSTLLQHGSLLLAQSRVAGMPPQGISLEELLGREVPWVEAAEAVEAAFRLHFPGEWKRQDTLRDLELVSVEIPVAQTDEGYSQDPGRRL